MVVLVVINVALLAWQVVVVRRIKRSKDWTNVVQANRLRMQNNHLHTEVALLRDVAVGILDCEPERVFVDAAFKWSEWRDREAESQAPE